MYTYNPLAFGSAQKDLKTWCMDLFINLSGKKRVKYSISSYYPSMGCVCIGKYRDAMHAGI